MTRMRNGEGDKWTLRGLPEEETFRQPSKRERAIRGRLERVRVSEGRGECYIATNKGANWIYATQLDQYTTLNSDNLICQEVWLNSYAGINATNEIISRIDEMSEEILNATPRYRAIAAEARFLQALWYFNMVRIFGGVPILTTPSRSSSNYEVDRNSIKEVYAYNIILLE